MLKYSISDKFNKWYEWIIYPLQQLLAILVATILIANICGTPITTCLIGAGIGTLVYQAITKFRSPMFISSCGATVSAVVGALALGGENYIAVAIGGLIILLVYVAFALIIKFKGIEFFNKFFPAIIIGPITMVIGLNLAKFIPTYVGIDWIPGLVALFTMVCVALFAYKGKGFMKTIAFLLGLLCGYIVALILELTGAYDFGIKAAFSGFQWFKASDFAFMRWANSPFEWSQLPDIILLFLPVSICAALEHYSDHKVLSGIISTDLTENPGLHRTLIADGVASAVGTMVGGLPNTSYGESVAVTGFSKVASIWAITIASAVLIFMGFFAPITVFFSSIPSAVFGGCAMILYGYISASGLNSLMAAKPDLDDPKNLIIVSVILTIGVSGMIFLSNSFTGVSLAMVAGVLLNLILRPKKNCRQ